MKETHLPNPSTQEVSLWLKSLNRKDLHDQGWLDVNRRFHGITFGLRPFINKHYSDPKEQEAAFDGATLALLTLAHFDDIDKLAELFIAAKPTRTHAKKHKSPNKLHKSN